MTDNIELYSKLDISMAELTQGYLIQIKTGATKTFFYADDKKQIHIIIDNWLIKLRDDK